MNRLKTVGLICVGSTYVFLIFFYALSAPLRIDDSTDLVRLGHPPTWSSEATSYRWAIESPALYRWVDYGALISCGADEKKAAVTALRCVNAAWLVGALACTVLLARGVTGGWGWGLVVAAPLALSGRFGAGVGGAVSPDAAFTFFLALMALVWVRHDSVGNATAWRRVFVMGTLGGLALSTRYGAAFALTAYAVHLVGSRGAAGLSRAAVLAATVAAVFIAVNPVMWRGGPIWWGTVWRDAIELRAGELQLRADGIRQYAARLSAAFPMWYVAPVLAWLFWRARRARWFVPLALWAGCLALGAALTAYDASDRNLVPLQMPLIVLVMLSAVSLYLGDRGSGILTIRVKHRAETQEMHDEKVL